MQTIVDFHHHPDCTTLNMYKSLGHLHELYVTPFVMPTADKVDVLVKASFYFLDGHRSNEELSDYLSNTIFPIVLEKIKNVVNSNQSSELTITRISKQINELALALNSQNCILRSFDIDDASEIKAQYALRDWPLDRLQPTPTVRILRIVYA